MVRRLSHVTIMSGSIPNIRSTSLLVHTYRWRGAWRRSRIRDCEGEPCIPTLRPILGSKLAVRLQTEESLLSGDWENIPQLRPGGEDSGLECTNPVASAAVRADLVVGIPDKANKELLRQKLRGTPIQMEINSALILGSLVLEIIRKAGNRRKLMPSCGVEIRVAAAAVDGAVSQAEIGKACRTVIADRNIPGDVGHEIMNPGVPLQ